MYGCFEAAMVSHCAATLAGHKCGSLFLWRRDDGEDVRQTIERLNRALNDRDIYLRVLKHGCSGELIYVYRAEALKRRLDDPEIQSFLQKYGYVNWGEAECLNCLERHIRCEKLFPHEIGIFLDYPLEDVLEFIRNGGKNYLCLGCWKVYAQVEEAQRKFALFRKCSRIYQNCYDKGIDVVRLTVPSSKKRALRFSA